MAIAAAQGETMRYEELRLTIQGGAGAYGVRATLGERGLFEDNFELPVVERDAHAFSNLARSKKQVVTRGVSLDPVKELGERLFVALFPGRREAIYRQALESAWSRGNGLRLRLEIPDTPVADLPWEFLYDPTRDDFAALSARSPLIRQGPAHGQGRRPTAPELPLRVLVVGAPVIESMHYGIVEELRVLEALNGESQSLALHVLPNATIPALRHALAEHCPHIIHFAATGMETQGGAAQVLVLLDERGTLDGMSDDILPQQMLDSAALSTLLAPYAQTVRLILFNGCHTNRLAAALATTIPIVLGARDILSDYAATPFAEGFLRAVLARQPAEAALTQGRQAIDRREPGNREWGLYEMYTLLSAEQLPGLLLDQEGGWRSAYTPNRNYETPPNAPRVGGATGGLSGQHDGEPSTGSAGGDELEAVPPTADPAAALDPADRLQWEELTALRALHTENLDLLQQQMVRYGADLPVFVQNQLDETNQALREIDAALAALVTPAGEAVP